MAQWVTKKIFKKNLLRTMLSGQIYLPTVTGTSNWDRDNLVFLSGMNEMDVSEHGRAVVKEETNKGDLLYDIGYKKIVPYMASKSNPRTQILNTKYTFSNCYYVDLTIYFGNWSGRDLRNNLETYADRRGAYVSKKLDVMLDDNIKVTTISNIIYGSRHHSYVDGTVVMENVPCFKKIRVYMPDLETHSISFIDMGEDLSLYDYFNNNYGGPHVAYDSSRMLMGEIKRWQPNLQDSQELNTNIVIGENVKVIK